VFPAIQEWLRDSTPIDDACPPPVDCPAVSFVELWLRIATGASAALAASLPTTVGASVLRDLRDQLIIRLSEVGEATVWQHFNDRRTLGDLVSAHLDADERGFPRAIYCRMAEGLRADGLQTLTDMYPVLRRHLWTTVDNWHASSRELLTRVAVDHQLLAETFDLPADAQLTGIQPGLSDPHRGGRSVAILTFASKSAAWPATPCAVVYKPKDLRADAAYQQLISELPAPSAADGPLRGLTVLPRAGYGYMEYLGHEVCATADELRAFYRNAGRLTAVLYVLGANDCHNENLIAHHGQLVLVDAETAFQGVMRLPVIDRRSLTARSELQARIADSVINIGLLPQWYFVGRERIPRDVSALGISAPMTERVRATGWIALNTDGMASGNVESPARLPTSLPVGIGSASRLSEFAEEYCDGFACQLAAVATARPAWLSYDGYLARFRNYRSRFIRRPTWVYLWMRRQLCEPAALTGDEDQRRALAGCLRGPDSGGADDESLLAAETAQLGRLDVPFFEHSADGLDLVADGGISVPRFFRRSGVDNARRKVELLDDAEIELQLALIRGVLAAKDLRSHRAGGSDPAILHAHVAAPSDDDRRCAAAAVGEHLVRTAVVDGDGNVEWIGIDAADDVELASYGALGPSLYGGRLGIAVFLAALAQAERDQGVADRYRATALGACADFLRLLAAADSTVDKRRWWRDQPLGLAGAGGQLLALLLLTHLLPELESTIGCGLAALVNFLDPQLLRDDDDLDVVFGCAGLIGPLVKMGTSSAMALARVAGDRLVERQDGGGGWILPSIGSRALTGFSHGASGMAAALARLGAQSGHHTYLAAAARALEYERSQFDPRVGNWPDLRGEEGEPTHMSSWCHGAPGIALARLSLSGTPLWDAKTRQDLHDALPPTTDAARPEDCVCCGRFGRAAILRAASDRGGDPRWRQAAAQLEALGLAGERAVGSYTFGDVPGLFQGYAGVGLALLESTRRTTTALLPAILSAGLLE
jgi:type 2 lantibiotic biosynthesis protein LanM